MLLQGHFQIVLSRRHSPLMIRGLSPFMRILYCSGVWSYIVGAITTPLFIIIPLLTIWAGIFPIVISWWAALALTIYYIAQSMVLNYSKKVSQRLYTGIPSNAFSSHALLCATAWRLLSCAASRAQAILQLTYAFSAAMSALQVFAMLVSIACTCMQHMLDCAAAYMTRGRCPC